MRSISAGSMFARLRAESRLVFSGMPSTRTSMVRPRRVWPKSVMVRLESDMPGTLFASRVARLSEPWRSSSSCSRSMTFTWRTCGTRLLEVREAVTSIASSSTGCAMASAAPAAGAWPGTTT
ncbi:hypothetical protein D3C81_1253980 [compost metagenome]